MRDEDFIKKAMLVAKATEAHEGVPIGCVVVNSNGQIISEGMSLTVPLNDATCHGEIMAIRKACRKLKTIDLNGLTLYSTLEPCGMCLSAAVWANLQRIVFGAYAEDVGGNNYEIINYSSIDNAKDTQRWNGHPIEVVGGVLRQECAKLMAAYKDWQKIK